MTCRRRFSRPAELIRAQSGREKWWDDLVPGNIYRSKSGREKAINHFEIALGIAFPFGWHDELLWIYYSLAEIFSVGGMFEDARDHVERAKAYTVDNPYFPGGTTMLQTRESLGRQRQRHCVGSGSWRRSKQKDAQRPTAEYRRRNEIDRIPDDL